LLSNKDKGVTTQHLVALACASAPTASSLAKCGSARPSTCCRHSTPATTAAWHLFTPAARALLSRLESMALLGIPPARLEARRHAQAHCRLHHYVVHMKRTGEMRHVSEIIEIKGFRDNDYDIKRVF
jgi:hypothetical protein